MRAGRGGLAESHEVGAGVRGAENVDAYLPLLLRLACRIEGCWYLAILSGHGSLIGRIQC